MKRTLAEFARACGGRLSGADAAFTDVVSDSRKLTGGQLFVALSGPNFDGGSFVAAAAKAGAAGAVVSAAQPVPLPQIVVPDTQAALERAARSWRGQFAGPLVGVAGSNGKTTAKEMTASILAQAGECLATRGNLNNHIGVPLTLLRLTDAHRFAVIEMGGNHAGEVAALIEPGTEVVGIDEGQFFDNELVGVVNELARRGLRVIVAGLDQDYLGRPFEPMPQLLAIAEYITKTLAICVVCGDPANHTQRLVASSDRVLVGDANGLPRNVGGAAVHADMKYPRFRPSDFQLGTLLGAIPGASFTDWPVDYATLERFYVEIEQAVGVQGPEVGGDPFAPAKSKPYPMPPGLPMYANTILAEAARRLGYHPFAYPTAVTSRPYRGRPACIDCGFCSGYGCPTHAKSSPAVTLLRRSEKCS